VVIPLEYHQDLWHEKTKVTEPPCSINMTQYKQCVMDRHKTNRQTRDNAIKLWPDGFFINTHSAKSTGCWLEEVWTGWVERYMDSTEVKPHHVRYWVRQYIKNHSKKKVTSSSCWCSSRKSWSWRDTTQARGWSQEDRQTDDDVDNVDDDNADDEGSWRSMTTAK